MKGQNRVQSSVATVWDWELTEEVKSDGGLHCSFCLLLWNNQPYGATEGNPFTKFLTLKKLKAGLMVDTSG